MPRAQDRRVLKTKAQLRTALTGLLEKKPLQEITVKELCEACDINRGTFYLHYPDVRALLDEIVDDLMTQFEAMLGSFRPNEMLLRSENAQQVKHLLHELPDPYKEVFMWRTLGELSFKEIGKLFHKTENWACVTYHRARKMIQKGMEVDKDEK